MHTCTHMHTCAQDQLIIQVIKLMDRILKKQNLDLKLTPYEVLAMEGRNGPVEWRERVRFVVGK